MVNNRNDESQIVIESSAIVLEFICIGFRLFI